MGPYHGNLVNHRSGNTSFCSSFIMGVHVMREQLEKRIHDLAEHLIQLEQDAKLIKQKRAKSSVTKFHLSTG